eukprot:4581358-Amphidinium_carterae.1
MEGLPFVPETPSTPSMEETADNGERDQRHRIASQCQPRIGPKDSSNARAQRFSANGAGAGMEAFHVVASHKKGM